MQNPDLVIVGTVALDNVQTPFGKVNDAFGGSAAYASLAASLFSKVGIVAVIGDDYPQKYLEEIKAKNIDISGIKKLGKTFRWSGSYEYDMNNAKTLKTELNNLLLFDPLLPESYKKAKYFFLGNIDPALQLKVLSQADSPKLVSIDTMNYWIQNKSDELIDVLKKSDLLFINEAEARELFKTPNLVKAAKSALSLGLKYVIIKKGENGAALFSKNSCFIAPGYPLESIKDPTGAGDSFAGSIIGYLSSVDKVTEETLRKAVIYGTVIASINVEGFSVDKLRNISMPEVDKRISEIKKMMEF